MGKLNKGILGGFSGTVGTVVGSNWRGMDIIRSLPKKSGNAPSEKQALQQAKFALAHSFLTPLRALQSVYFGNRNGTLSQLNQSTSYMLTEAIEVVEGIPKIVYSKVLIAKGDIATVQNPTVAAESGGILKFDWEDNSAQAKASADDVFCTVIYCEELNQFVINDGPANRSLLTDVKQMPASMLGNEVHIYAFFHKALGNNASASVYLGSMKLV